MRGAGADGRGMAMTDWIHNYPGVVKLLQQEGDVLEGVRQDAEPPAAAPRPLWERLPPQTEPGCVVLPPHRCGCQRPIVRWEYDGPSGHLRLFHEACTCAWQLIVIRELLRLPPLPSGLWVQRLSGHYQQVTLVRSGGACRARDHAVSLRRFLQRIGARLVDPASWVTSL
jgi:hypothetical protein